MYRVKCLEMEDISSDPVEKKKRVPPPAAQPLALEAIDSSSAGGIGDGQALSPVQGTPSGKKKKKKKATWVPSGILEHECPASPTGH